MDYKVMEKGGLEYAIRKAQNHFDEWNEATGYFTPFSGYYYEAQSCIEDAVKIGAMVASGLEVRFDDGELIEDK